MHSKILKKLKKYKFFRKKIMKIIVDETSMTLIDMKYKIKKEIETNYKIIIAIFNIIKRIIGNMKSIL